MTMSETFIARFRLPGYWDRAERRRARDQRKETGYTSVRVTRATARALEAFARRLAARHPGWNYGAKIPLDELLAAIAAAEPSIDTSADEKACKPTAGVGMHATQPAGDRTTPFFRRSNA